MVQFLPGSLLKLFKVPVKLVEIIYSRFFNENFAFWLKNDIYCSWFMVLLNQFCDNLYWAWHKITCNTVFYLHEM